MSTKTIIEIDHNHFARIHTLTRNDLIDLLRRAMTCGPDLSRSNGVQHCCGVKTLAQRHHTSSVSVTVDEKEVFGLRGGDK